MTGYLKTTILMAFLTALVGGIGYMLGGENGLVIALLISAGMNVFAWFNSDKMVLSHYGARQVGAEDAPKLVSMIAELASNAGLPMPRVYVIENDQPNAFATGRNPSHAAVAITTGLMRRLEPDEIAGVMAHELAHIKHRDTLIMTVTATLAGALSMLANFGMFMGRSRDGEGRPVSPIVSILVMIWHHLPQRLSRWPFRGRVNMKQTGSGPKFRDVRARLLLLLRKSLEWPGKS